MTSVPMQSVNLFTLMLGDDTRRKTLLQRTLIAGLIYLISAVFIGLGITLGKATPEAGEMVIAYEFLGFGLFYASIRAGWTQRLADPALTMPQILHGLGAVVLCYMLIPAGRSLTLPMLSLSLTFALLSRLTPRQTMFCGLSACAMIIMAFLVAYVRGHEGLNVTQEAVNLVMAAITLPVFASVSRQVKEWRDRVDDQRQQMSKLIDDLRLLAARDELTGLVNRRTMNAVILEELLRIKRHRRAACVAILDVDNFKQVNDALGHHEGDRVLVELARHLSGHFNRPDHLARWGGEEFVILLPECTAEAAQAMIDAARRTLNCTVALDGQEPRRITFSTGLSVCRPGDDPASVIARADAALYEAKRSGKNRVVIG